MLQDIRRSPRRTAATASAVGAGVGLLGGLIGLGGAEFRLPLLMGTFSLAVHCAVRLNALVSLATVAAAAPARLALGQPHGLADLGWEIAAVGTGAVGAAWIGAGALARLDPRRLTGIVAALLAVIAAILLAEAALGLASGAGLSGPARLPAGLALGVAIGLVSAMLGVAGGELLIPAFMLVLGAEVATAGTASLLVSLPMVAVGVLRFARQGAYGARAELLGLAAPMAAGSAAGALAGAALLPFAPTAALKATLGLVLAISSVKLARKG